MAKTKISESIDSRIYNLHYDNTDNHASKRKEKNSTTRSNHCNKVRYNSGDLHATERKLTSRQELRIGRV